jgi:hypothetical protein
MVCFHVKPRRLLTAAAMLNTIEVNQKALTASSRGVLWLSKVYCKVLAVTAEKNVATVVRLRRLAAPCSCAKRMVGTPGVKMGRFALVKKKCSRGPIQTDLNEYREGRSDGLYVFTKFR